MSTTGATPASNLLPQGTGIGSEHGLTISAPECEEEANPYNRPLFRNATNT